MPSKILYVALNNRPNRLKGAENTGPENAGTPRNAATQRADTKGDIIVARVTPPSNAIVLIDSVLSYFLSYRDSL